jgi:hypothetical protein
VPDSVSRHLQLYMTSKSYNINKLIKVIEKRQHLHTTFIEDNSKISHCNYVVFNKGRLSGVFNNSSRYLRCSIRIRFVCWQQTDRQILSPTDSPLLRYMIESAVANVSNVLLIILMSLLMIESDSILNEIKVQS